MKRTGKLSSEAGLSMLEIMIALAVVGILAKLALPSLAGSSRKVKGDSEVNAFLAELRMKEEQYHVENGRYLSTGTSETNAFPATPSPQLQPLGTLPATWQSLRVRAPMTEARCNYIAIAGRANTGTVGTTAGSFGFTVPAHDWYYVLAHCDLDGNTASDSYYFTSSDDAAVKKLNPGK